MSVGLQRRRQMWRADPDQTPGTQMARDEDLWRAAQSGASAGRVYEWNDAHVTLGFNQSTALMDKANIGWTRRPTGGKAVLHGHDVTLSLAMPLTALGLNADSRSVKVAYRAMANPLIRALNEVGIPATLAEETPFVRGAGKVADCFAHVSPNDIVHPATGQKVCGCALAIRNCAVLLQASVPVRTPLVDPATLGLGGVSMFSPCQATFDDWVLALNRASDL
ncbi:MAG: hypothetical protein KF812_03300 [Fimbriimonadaceae bacterium]|nr:hypothetical protein [Fimbriimonadaceae bacterium]